MIQKNLNSISSLACIFIDPNILKVLGPILSLIPQTLFKHLEILTPEVEGFMCELAFVKKNV